MVAPPLAPRVCLLSGFAAWGLCPALTSSGRAPRLIFLAVKLCLFGCASRWGTRCAAVIRGLVAWFLGGAHAAIFDGFFKRAGWFGKRFLAARFARRFCAGFGFVRFWGRRVVPIDGCCIIARFGARRVCIVPNLFGGWFARRFWRIRKPTRWFVTVVPAWVCRRSHVWVCPQNRAWAYRHSRAWACRPACCQNEVLAGWQRQEFLAGG